MKRQYIKRRINIAEVRVKYNRAGMRPPNLYTQIAKFINEDAVRTRDVSIAVDKRDGRFLNEVRTMLRDDGFTVNAHAVDANSVENPEKYVCVLHIEW